MIKKGYGCNGRIMNEPTHDLPLPRMLTRVGVKDVVMIAVKGYHTQSAIESAMPMIGDDTVVLSVQNGLGNLEVIADAVGPERVVGGITGTFRHAH